ncbi:hypothetical protein PM082_001797 [Marasmius tenuissimus]|nr:hypothetical protein PM082_001797 [Marasmius tenuissimus]
MLISAFPSPLMFTHPSHSTGGNLKISSGLKRRYVGTLAGGLCGHLPGSLIDICSASDDEAGVVCTSYSSTTFSNHPHTGATRYANPPESTSRATSTLTKLSPSSTLVSPSLLRSAKSRKTDAYPASQESTAWTRWDDTRRRVPRTSDYTSNQHPASGGRNGFDAIELYWVTVVARAHDVSSMRRSLHPKLGWQ